MPLICRRSKFTFHGKVDGGFNYDEMNMFLQTISWHYPFLSIYFKEIDLQKVEFETFWDNVAILEFTNCDTFPKSNVKVLQNVTQLTFNFVGDKNFYIECITRESFLWAETYLDAVLKLLELLPKVVEVALRIDYRHPVETENLLSDNEDEDNNEE